MKQVEIYCKNCNSVQTYPLGTSLLEISKELNIQSDNVICGAIVNNEVKELSETNRGAGGYGSTGK